MAASIKASNSGLSIVDTLRREKGWTKYDQRWIDAAYVSVGTLKRFWGKKAISRDSFVKICEALDIDWRKITDLGLENLEHLIKQDIGVWNKWKYDNPATNYTLDNMDLHGLDLQGADFSGTSLVGANLSGSNLSDASLAEANLSNANFRGVNLQGANLTRVQALGTIFIDAIFTGACLEDWNINSTTQLENVQCEFIYRKAPKLERQPSIGVFKPGDFSALFQEVKGTISLVFQEGINWQAFDQMLQELRSQYTEQNPTVQSIENKQGKTIVAHLKVSSGVNKSVVERNAQDFYTTQLSLMEQQHKTQLQVKELDSVASSIFEPIGKTEDHLIKRVYKAHQNLSDIGQTFEVAIQNYRNQYINRHGQIKVLPGLMKEAVSVDSIYTTVKFLGGSDLRYFSSLNGLEEFYRTTNQLGFNVDQDARQDGLTVANNEQYVMVLGGPGVGKSTFLRKLGLDALEGRLAHNLMPVFIELKSFRSEEMGLQQGITKELEVSGFPHAESLVESMLSDGKMLILLDGLDEVPFRQVDNVIGQIRNFCDQHSQNRFVVSCRTAAYKGGFNRFTDVTIAEFDDEQIQQFIQLWFNSELDVLSHTAQNFWEILQQPENASAMELAQTPLLLTFLCLVYDRSQSLPSVRSILYGDALNIILRDWAAEKRIKQDPIYQGFHADLEKVLLSEIAYQSFKADQLFFSEQGITERITEFLTDTLSAPKHLDGTAVLHAIEVQQGILVERATNAYSFSHLTLQEYLTARYISRNNLIQELVSEYLTDKRWREVFLLVSGLLEERSQELWLLMKKQANVFTREPKLQGLLQWVVSLNETSQPSSQALALRTLLLESASDISSAIVSANAFTTNRVIARIINRTVNIDNVLSAKLEELKKQIPSNKATSLEWRRHTESLIETYLTFFHLDRDLITFTPKEAQALEKYLYAVKLIIDCKNAAVRVSRKEWEAIESRLLTPQGEGASDDEDGQLS